MRQTFFLVPLLLLLSSCSSFDPAVLDKLKKLPQLPTLESLLNKPPVTTSFADAHAEVALLDDTIPENARAFPMTSMPRDPQGRYLLGPGLYELEAQSYCIKAGTHAPSLGDGYLYAPLKGPREKIVRAILRRSAEKPEIEQHDVQVLLWAVIARAKLRDMNPQLQRTATALLDTRELFELNGGALGLIPPEMIDKYMAKLSPQLQKVFRAEQQLRQHLERANATYQQYEQLAVLAGLAPAADVIRPTPRGRWSWHPDGYFIRYFPQGYQRTRMQVYVPPPLTIERDDEGRIAAVADGRTFRVETSYEGSTITEVRLTAFGKTIKRKPTAVRTNARETSRVTSMETQLAAMTLPSGGPLPSSSADLIADAEAWATAVRQSLAGCKEKALCGEASLSVLTHLAASALDDQLGDAREGPVTFDPSGNVAVPANTSSQRLASGGEPVREPGERWFESLPDCPCTWGGIRFNQTVRDKKGNPGRWTATAGSTLKDFHPGAAKEVRWTPKGGGAGQQCTYDQRNKLITGGLAVGTPDFYGPYNFFYFLAHQEEDVLPSGTWGLWDLFDLGISCDIYMKLYPPNQGNGCTDNIVGPPPSSTLTCWGQTH